MPYNALRQMREKNMQDNALKKYKIEIGPMEPECAEESENCDDMKSAVIRFIRERCVDLRFDEEVARRETLAQSYEGTSSKRGQIPYNMQMDLDRLCMERAATRFLESGVAEDAFDVYFCYLEMFVGKYGKSRRMIELLSEFETNSSSLLMKHRDHYSHSVYVFLLGLAIYETNEIYCKAYMNEYQLENEQEAAHHYLKYWGLTALFHDIGYPFELPFEQVCSYFEVGGVKRNSMPFISYNGMEGYTALEKNQQELLSKLYGGKIFSSTNEVFAYEITTKFGKQYNKDESEILEILKTKTTNPDNYNYFMDHAYFSATILIKELLRVLDEENAFTKSHIDAIVAILLHNSLYKFSITNVRGEENIPFRKELHPLAYMLMLCDELQCWDRTSYGRNSRTELHPMNCYFTFKKDEISAVYVFDDAEKEKIEKFEKLYKEYQKNPTDGKEPTLKAYGSMVHKNSFLREIEKILNLEGIRLIVQTTLEEADNSSKQIYLSNTNFLHLYDFAVALNAQYNNVEEDAEEMMESFEKMSLEYKLSNVLQAKEFKKHLDSLGYFYTDRPVAYEMIQEFTDEELIFLGIREHGRWEAEKRDMCWIPARDVQEVYQDKALREQTRMHYDLDVVFEDLSVEEQLKDMKPLNTMMKKLKEFDGLRIYSIGKKRNI